MNNYQSAKLRACISEIVKMSLAEVLTDENKQKLEFPFFINSEMDEGFSV